MNRDSRQCRHCGAAPGERPFCDSKVRECATCARQVDRIGGCPECTGPRRAAPEGGPYCPVCRDPGDVQLVLIAPDGRERVTWHPRRARVIGARETVGQRVDRGGAQTLPVGFTEFFSAAPKAKPAETYWGRKKIDCQDCGASVRKRVATTVRCGPCARQYKREYDRAYYRRKWLPNSAGRVCRWCRRTSSLEPGARKTMNADDECHNCVSMAGRNGRCETCQGPRVATLGMAPKGQRYCPRCTKPERAHRGEVAFVFVTDGVRREYRPVCGRGAAPGGAMWLNFPVTPTVEVEPWDYDRGVLKRGHVTMGRPIRGMGPASFLALEVLQRAWQSTGEVAEALGEERLGAVNALRRAEIVGLAEASRSGGLTRWRLSDTGAQALKEIRAQRKALIARRDGVG